MSPNTRYRFGDKIGGRYLVHFAISGGMGEVYLCLDIEKDFPLALKTFKAQFLQDHNTSRALSIFREEVATWIALENHPNIVRCYVMEDLDDQPFMFLEWVAHEEGQGTDLRNWLRCGPLNLQLALDFTIDICHGLIHANQKQPGIVHRDLKPENILIGQGRIAKLTDFGLAKIAQDFQFGADAGGENSEQARVSNLGGTPLYMAPEQWRGVALDARTDIYGVGGILYEMLTGRSLFHSATISGLKSMHLEAPLPVLTRPGAIYGKLNVLLSRCLGKHKSERFSTPDELLEAISPIYQEEFGVLPKRLVEPQIPQASDLINRGATFIRLKRYDRALTYIDRSLELDNHSALAHYNRGVIMQSQGRHEEALPHFERAIQLDPQDAMFYYNRGLVYSHLNQYDMAQADYRKAIALDPTHAPSHYNLAKLLASSGFKEDALKECELAVVLDSEDPLAYHNRAGVLFMLGRTEEAMRDYNKAIELNPSNPSSYIMRAGIYESQGERARAIADFKRAAELGNTEAARLLDSFVRTDAMNAFSEADSPEEMRRKAEQFPIMTDPSFHAMLRRDSLQILEDSMPPDSRFDMRLAFEVKLSWLKHFADEDGGQAESLLRTEDDFLNASVEAFFTANTRREMTDVTDQFPYLMAAFMPEVLENALQESTPEGKSKIEQKLSWLRKIIEVRTQEWQQAAHNGGMSNTGEIVTSELSSEVDQMELALTMFASTESYAEMQEVVTRYPSLASTEFVSNFGLGIEFVPPEQRVKLEERLNWLRQISSERK